VLVLVLYVMSLTCGCFTIGRRYYPVVPLFLIDYGSGLAPGRSAGDPVVWALRDHQLYRGILAALCFTHNSLAPGQTGRVERAPHRIPCGGVGVSGRFCFSQPGTGLAGSATFIQETMPCRASSRDAAGRKRKPTNKQILNTLPWRNDNCRQFPPPIRTVRFNKVLRSVAMTVRPACQQGHVVPARC
jgi:hypothetical protein